MTKPSEEAPITIDVQFNCSNTIKPTLNCPERYTHASSGFISLLTNGRFLVRSTFASISLSHKSFIVHPAPRIINAPHPKRANVLRSGNPPAVALNAILHPHGQNRSHEPVVWFKISIKLLFQFEEFFFFFTMKTQIFTNRSIKSNESRIWIDVIFQLIQHTVLVYNRLLTT